MQFELILVIMSNLTNYFKNSSSLKALYNPVGLIVIIYALAFINVRAFLHKVT